MPVEATTRVDVKDTIKALRRLEPEAAKQFVKDIKGVVAPMVADAKSKYPDLPISGMARSWSQGAAQKFPWDVAKVRRAVKVKTSTRKNRASVVYVSQGSAPGAIFEVVKDSPTPLGRSIRRHNPTVLWPAYDRHSAEIQRGVLGIITDAEKTVQGMMP